MKSKIKSKSFSVIKGVFMAAFLILFSLILLKVDFSRANVVDTRTEILEGDEGGGGGGGGTIDPPVPEIIIDQITAIPERRFGAFQTNHDTRFAFSLLDPSTLQTQFVNNGLLQSRPNGIYNGVVRPAVLSAGYYNALIKTEAHLSLMVPNIEIHNGSNQINFTNIGNLPEIGSLRLKAGDVNGVATEFSSLGDDVVNSVDISILLKDYNRIDTTGNSIRSNLNQDQQVDLEDLQIMIDNLDQEGEYPR